MAVIFSKDLKRKKAAQERKLKLRASLWPDVNGKLLWLPTGGPGYLRVPRALPLILRIMDMLSPKGKPVSHAYLDLWFRTFDDAFVIANKRKEMAYYSGFTGERAEHTWSTRIKILEELGFVRVKEGAGGAQHYILILNPFHVIQRHHAEGRVQEAAYNALRDRLIEIRATDLDEPAESA